MEHEHHHHEHVQPLKSLNTVFILSIVLNLLFVAVESGVGFLENSLGLLSDAGHNLSDVFSLVLAMIAFKLAKLPATKRYTYGYKKSTILISLLNAIILLFAVGFIVFESIEKFNTPQIVDGAAISWTAGMGIVVNGLTAWLLMKNQKGDINVRGAFLHMAADALVSVGVVVSGVIITFTGSTIVDPIVSLIIAVVILISTWKLLVESLRLSLDGIPESVDLESVDKILAGNEHVKSFHHVHVWAISTTDVALTAHVVIDKVENMEAVKDDIKHRLRDAGISHSTIEMECNGKVCRDRCD